MKSAKIVLIFGIIAGIFGIALSLFFKKDWQAATFFLIAMIYNVETLTRKD